MLLFFLIRTSANQSSCTLGVWGAYDPLNKALVLDTEGMLGISNTSKQRKRLLLKVSVLHLDCSLSYPFPLHNQSILLHHSILFDLHTHNVLIYIILFNWEHLNPWHLFFVNHSRKASIFTMLFHLKILFLFFFITYCILTFYPTLFILIFKSGTKLVSVTLLSDSMPSITFQSQEACCQSLSFILFDRE